jgi:class 3 adenylate cyclase
MSKEVEPHIVMEFLNRLYTVYDDLCGVYGVYKVETVGDCYVVAGGLIQTDEEGFSAVVAGSQGSAHAQAVFKFAKAILREAAGHTYPHNGQSVRLRVGLHSGPIVSGVIGRRMPKFCLFGELSWCANWVHRVSIGLLWQPSPVWAFWRDCTRFCYSQYRQRAM